MAADSSAAQAVEKPISLSQNGCLALLALLVLHRAKLLASNQSILALGVAPSGVRAAAPHSAPARMPGVYAQGLCTMQSQPSIHSPSPRGRGLGLGIENLLYIYKNRLFLQAEADPERSAQYPYSNFTCKPSFVVCDHLSTPCVAADLKPP